MERNLKEKNIPRRYPYASALFSTHLPALMLFVLKGRAGMKGYPVLGCSSSDLREMEPPAATQRDSESKIKVEKLPSTSINRCGRADCGAVFTGSLGMLGLPVRLAADLLSVPVRGLISMEITCSSQKFLLLLLPGSSWDTSLTSPGLVFLLLQLTSSWSWQVEGQHKDLGIKCFITKRCKILTRMVNRKWPFCDGKWTNLWHAALLVSTMEGESRGDVSPACMQIPIKSKTPIQKEGLTERVCVLEKFLGKSR